MAWSVKYDPALAGNSPLVPASGALSIVGQAVQQALGVAMLTGALALSGSAPTVSVSGGSSAPVLLATNIVAGSATNGEGGAGAYLVLYGTGFGSAASMGTSSGAQVTINGQPIANYRYLVNGVTNGVRAETVAMQALCVQIGSAAVQALAGGISYAIGLTVNGVAANTVDVMGNPLDFIIQPGHFYYISLSGNDATGIVDDPTHPYRFLQVNTAPSNMNNPTYTGVWSTLKPGDTLILMPGTWSDQTGSDNRWMRCANRDGGTAPNGTIGNGYIHITAYPGGIGANSPAAVSFLCPSGGKGGIFGCSTAYARGGANGTNYGAYVTISDITFGMTAGGTMATTDSCPINFQNSADHWRVCNCDISWNTTTTNGLAAGIAGNGDPQRVFGNYIHDINGGAVGLQFHGLYHDGSNTDAHNVEADFNVIVNCNTGQCMMAHSEANDGFFNIYWHHNHCENSGKYCTKIDGFSGLFWMWNNVCVGSVRDGFGFENDSSAGGSTTGFVGHVEHNTFHDNYSTTSGPQGVLVNEGQTSTLLGSLDFSNNILSYSTGTGAYTAQWTSFSGCPATTHGNVYYDASGRLTTKYSGDTAGIYGNPQFINGAALPSFDPRLGVTSVALGRAVAATINPTNDIGMNAQPRSGQSVASCGACA